MIMISNFLFNFTNFCVIVTFFTKLLTLGILSSTKVKAAVLAKLIILGIFPLNSFILALRGTLVANLVVILGILSLTFLILALYTPFLTTSFFTTLLT